MDNTSGQGNSAAVPAEIDRWNWGAFLLNWIWGLGNGTYLALLMFVPVVNVVWPFVLGAKGSAWAWRNKRWESVEHFRRTQRKWAIGGLVAMLAAIALLATLFFSIFVAMKQSDIFQLGLDRVQASTEAMNALGAPVSTGFPIGSIEVSGPDGKASFSVVLEGSKANGTLYLAATRKLGQWWLDNAELEIRGRSGRINLLGASASRPAPAAAAQAAPGALPQAAPAPAPQATPPDAAAKPPAKDAAATAPAPRAADKEAPKAAPAPVEKPFAAPAAAPKEPPPPTAQHSVAVPRAARAASRRPAPDAAPRKCLELEDPVEVMRCAEAYR